MTALRKAKRIDPMKYHRWHVRLILEPYGRTCHKTKAEAQREADEIISWKPALKMECRPVQTLCAVRPISSDCIVKMPKKLAEPFMAKECCQCGCRGCEDCDNRIQEPYRFREPYRRPTIFPERPPFRFRDRDQGRSILMESRA